MDPEALKAKIIEETNRGLGVKITRPLADTKKQLLEVHWPLTNAPVLLDLLQETVGVWFLYSPATVDPKRIIESREDMGTWTRLNFRYEKQPPVANKFWLLLPPPPGLEPPPNAANAIQTLLLANSFGKYGELLRINTSEFAVGERVDFYRPPKSSNSWYWFGFCKKSVERNNNYKRTFINDKGELFQKSGALKMADSDRRQRIAEQLNLPPEKELAVLVAEMLEESKPPRASNNHFNGYDKDRLVLLAKPSSWELKLSGINKETNMPRYEHSALRKDKSLIAFSCGARCYRSDWQPAVYETRTNSAGVQYRVQTQPGYEINIRGRSALQIAREALREAIDNYIRIDDDRTGKSDAMVLGWHLRADLKHLNLKPRAKDNCVRKCAFRFTPFVSPPDPKNRYRRTKYRWSYEFTVDGNLYRGLPGHPHTEGRTTLVHTGVHPSSSEWVYFDLTNKSKLDELTQQVTLEACKKKAEEEGIPWTPEPARNR